MVVESGYARRSYYFSRPHQNTDTLFLKQPIDVLILNDQWKVVKMVTDLKPYSFLFYDPTYKIVIELPRGAIEKSKTHIGDKIFLA